MEIKIEGGGQTVSIREGKYYLMNGLVRIYTCTHKDCVILYNNRSIHSVWKDGVEVQMDWGAKQFGSWLIPNKETREIYNLKDFGKLILAIRGRGQGVMYTGESINAILDREDVVYG